MFTSRRAVSFAGFALSCDLPLDDRPFFGFRVDDVDTRVGDHVDVSRIVVHEHARRPVADAETLGARLFAPKSSTVMS